MATQCLITKRSKNMRVQVDGTLAPGVSSKDVVLHVIGKIGTAGGTGAVIEFCGKFHCFVNLHCVSLIDWV